jgi:hypothetical protein
MTRSLRYSDETIKRRKQTILWMSGVLSLAFPIYIAIVRPEMIRSDIGTMLIFFVILGALTVGSFAIVSALAARSWKELEVKILKDGIERQWGKTVEKVLFENIERIVVGKNRAGKVMHVKIYSPIPSMYLFGFQHMDKVARLIEQRVPETAAVAERRVIVDWSHPLNLILVSIPAMLALALAFAIAEKLGGNVANVLEALCSVAVGLLGLV